MKFLLGIILLTALAIAHPGFVQCDFSTPNDGDIRTTSTIAKMDISSIATSSGISLSPAAPAVGDSVTVTVTGMSSGYKGFVHVSHKSDSSAASLLTGDATSKCDGNRQETSSPLFSGTLTYTFTPTAAATYEIVAVGGSFSGFKRQVLDVVVTGILNVIAKLFWFYILVFTSLSFL